MNFQEAQEKVMKLKQKPGNDAMLRVYGLFKQATVGDVNTERPGVFNLKAKSKWDSWEGMKGMSTEDAEKQYVEFVQSLIDEFGLE